MDSNIGSVQWIWNDSIQLLFKTQAKRLKSFSSSGQIINMEQFTHLSHFNRSYLIYFKFLYYTGVFRTESKLSWSSIFYLTLQIYGVWLPLFVLVFEVYYAKNMKDYMEMASTFFAILAAFLRIINFQYRREKIIEILKIFQKLRYRDESKIIQQSEKAIMKNSSRLIVYTFCLIFLLNNIRFFLSDEPVSIYTNNIKFAKPWQHNLFFWVQLTQFGILFPVMIVVETVVFSFFVLLDAHLKCLMIKMSRISRPKNKRSEYVNVMELNKLIKNHQELREWVWRLIKKAFWW